MACEIEIVGTGVDVGSLREPLQSELADEIQLDVRREPTYRMVETAVLVAVATAAGSAITAIINGVFRVLEKRAGTSSATITVQAPNGAKIEVHGDVPPQRVAELVHQLGEFERVRIHVTT